MNNKSLIFETRTIREKSLCCPGIEIVKTRVVFKHENTHPSRIMKSYAASRQELISFKSLIKRSGRGKEIEFKRIGTVASNSPILQGVQAVGSALTPGNLSMIRSPIRSSITRALTPGIPGMRRPGRPGDGYSRCPEGYQYGGRFTDNQFSTCGQKLFAIPGPLGAAISLIARTIRRETPPTSEIASEVLGAGQYPEGQGIVRQPQIPKVTMSNPQKALAEIKKLVKPLGSVDTATARMVRRDGFVLEPVVPPSVLRTIPDNRDMEGATYMMSITSPDLIGQDELGLLSNTGVQSIKYILPGGSQLTLEKRRQLTVGERRKLGRTVNTAIASSNSQDPASKLKMVAQETGDGIKYSEEFVGISRPNEIGPSGKERWMEQAFRKRKKIGVEKPQDNVDVPNERTPQASEQIGKKITNLAAAVAHLGRGGSMSEVPSNLLQQALSKLSAAKRNKINDQKNILEMPNGEKYIEYVAPKKFEGIGQKFATEVQQHLGLDAPNVILSGTGESRKYFMEMSETVAKGGKIQDDAPFASAPFTEVARLMLSDVLTDSLNRNPGTVEIMTVNGKQKLISSYNAGAGLPELSQISITQRTELQLSDFLNNSNARLYLQYFKELKERQRAQYLQFIATLIERARAFNFSNFKAKLYADGNLNSAERIHLNILEKLYENRLEMLVSQNNRLEQLVSG